MQKGSHPLLGSPRGGCSSPASSKTGTCRSVSELAQGCRSPALPERWAMLRGAPSAEPRQPRAVPIWGCQQGWGLSTPTNAPTGTLGTLRDRAECQRPHSRDRTSWAQGCRDEPLRAFPPLKVANTGWRSLPGVQRGSVEPAGLSYLEKSHSQPSDCPSPRCARCRCPAPPRDAVIFHLDRGTQTAQIPPACSKAALQLLFHTLPSTCWPSPLHQKKLSVHVFKLSLFILAQF